VSSVLTLGLKCKKWQTINSPTMLLFIFFFYCGPH